MAYSYGPPPPAPPPAPPNNGPGAYGSYGQPYQQPSQRGGHASRGRGGGGSDRGGYHQPPQTAYGYGPQAPAYGQQQSSAPYPGPQPPQTAYPAPQQQQWHPEHPQQHPQQPNAHTPLSAQNYHPNFAPQIYGHAQPQPPPYGQPPYAPAPHYGPVYPAAGPQPGPPAHQWSGHAQPPNQASYGGGGRGGGRGGYNDRGGHKGQMMGPPIRIGFDASAQPAPLAPVSNPYPTTPYGAQGPPGPYPPAPYQAYPAPVPYVQGPPYDGHSGHNPRQRGGFHHHNNKPRGQFGGGKDRNRNQKGQAHVAQTPPTYHQKPDAASTGKKKKRKTNTLGLTPGDDSDEGEENEEDLAEQYGADAPKVTDIAAWIAERRAKFPTKARVEAKKTAAVSGKQQNGDAPKNDEEQALLEQRETLRRELERVESNIKRKREQQDEGDDMRNMDLGSPPSHESKSDDEKPEVMSTRQEDNNVPPPTRKADPKKHCKYYSTGGNCGKRGKCRFVHDPLVREQALKEREMNGGRMTLQQRLTLNDKQQEDLTIVQSLKYLQDKGVLTKESPAGGSSASNAEPEQKASTLPPPPIKREAGHGLPPIPPPSVVPPAQSQNHLYSGWNLSGYANTGVRSADN